MARPSHLDDRRYEHEYQRVLGHAITTSPAKAVECYYAGRRANDEPPYPFCRDPQTCAGKGYCPRDPACNE